MRTNELRAGMHSTEGPTDTEEQYDDRVPGLSHARGAQTLQSTTEDHQTMPPEPGEAVTDAGVSLTRTVATTVLSGFVFGYDMCIASSALSPLSSEFDLNDAWKQLVVAMVMVGATVGALAGGYAGERKGRRPVMLQSSVMFVLGSVVLAAAPVPWMLLIGRFIVGYAIGASSIVGTVYLAEVAPPKVRGVVVALYEVALCGGCLAAFAIGAMLSGVPSSWRWMLGLAAVPAAVQLVLLRSLPESILWRQQRAAALQRIRSDNVGNQPVDAARQSWFGAVLQHPKALLLAVLIALAQNAAFSNAILYYIEAILRSAAVPAPSIFSLIVACMKFSGVVVGTACMKTCGRRRILLVGTLGESLAFAIVGSALLALNEGDTARPHYVVAGLCLFVLCWNFSWAPLMFVVCSEVVPLSARAAGMGIAMGSYWASCIVTNGITLTLLSALGPGSFFVVLSITSLLPCGLIAAMPETANHGLHTIAATLRTRSDATDTASSSSIELAAIRKHCRAEAGAAVLVNDAAADGVDESVALRGAEAGHAGSHEL